MQRIILASLLLMFSAQTLAAGPNKDLPLCSNNLLKTVKSKCGKSDCNIAYRGFLIRQFDGNTLSLTSPKNAYFNKLFGLSKLTSLQRVAKAMRRNKAYEKRVEYYNGEDTGEEYIEIDDFVKCQTSKSFYLHVYKNSKNQIEFSVGELPFF